MKKNSSFSSLLLVLVVLVAAFFLILWQKEKRELSSIKKKYLFFKEITDSCKIDTTYQVVYIDPDDPCDYIVIKKKESKLNFEKLESYKNEKNKGIFVADYLDSANAIKYIQNYNEMYNADLSNTSYIDFETSVIMKYLVDIKAMEPALRNVKVYLGNYGTDVEEDELQNRTSAIFVPATSTGEYLNWTNKETVNYGGLCPPPSSYTELDNNGSRLLCRAIELSQAGTLLKPGRTRIVKHP